MENSKPKITVVTVCFNAVNEIEKTILSVINQTYDNIEYIVIDGGSKDGTVDIIKKYSNYLTYWVSEPDKGIYDAMNKGIAAASGDYINFMNAGDTFVSNTTVDETRAIIEHDTDIIYGDYYILNRKKSPDPIYKKPLIITKIITKYPICHQATFSKLDYMKTHLFDISYKICADWNFFRKGFIENNLRFQYINIPICYFDCNAGMSHDNLDLLYKERYRCMGIDRNPIKKLPHEILRLCVHLKRFIFRLLQLG